MVIDSVWESAYGPETSSELGGAGSRAIRRYIIRADDEPTARFFLKIKIDDTYENLILDGYDVRYLAPGLYEAEVRYGFHDDQPTASFDTTGATQRITEAISQEHYARAGETAPDVGNRIGDDGEHVEGVEIVVPTLRYSESHVRGTISPQYLNALIRLTGTVNSADWKGFPVFSLLFLGARGQQRPDGKWSIDYDFLAGVNRSAIAAGSLGNNAGDPFGGLQIDDIDVALKYAHDYLWVRYIPEVDAGAKTLRGKVQSVHVAKVYQSEDFGRLEIGNSTPAGSPGASAGGFWDE